MLISNESIAHLTETLDSAEIAVSVDTETNITDRYHERYCMGVSFCVDGRETFYVPVGHDSWMDPDGQNVTLPVDLLRHVGVPLVLHNAKFDIHVLRKLGIKLNENHIVYDTMLMCHLIQENEFSFSLQAMGNKYVGEGKEKDLSNVMSKAMKWEETPAWAMAKYAEKDAKLTYDLYIVLKPYFEIYEDLWLKYDMKFMLILQAMEEKGLPIDLDEAAFQKAKCITRINKIDADLGFNPKKQRELHKALFALPPDGLGLKPLSYTPTGKAQVNTKFLEATNHPVCGLLLERSRIDKQVTSYYNSYEELCSGYGRLHPSFKQHGTVTGRLSCANPNMQQIPRESPIKRLFLPEDGRQLWEIDYRNIEMRLAAVYSQETALLDIFAAEGDAHQLTADLLGVSRQFAKVINFLIIYGGGKDALAYQLGISTDAAKKILDNYNAAYPRLYATRMACGQACIDNGGWIKMWSGRRRHFLQAYEYHKAFNSIIQGGAFEIVKRSMINLHAAGFDMRNQVHDSVWFSFSSLLAAREVKEAEHIMTSWTEEAFGLKFSVDSKCLSS